MTEVVALDALSLSRAIRLRQISCREVMRAYLDRISSLNPVFNAIVSLEPEDRLLEQADRHDALLARGEYLGWMHGMPQAPKDVAMTRGIRTTFGSPLLKNFVPQEDSLAVARVRAAGAILIGKTNVPEFALGSQTYNKVFGATGNAWNDLKTAGGSSGGAAAALALRMLPVADGSDMMGSLRNPAAFNNVYGLRPSRGRVPSALPDLFCQQLATDGPMARHVADLAMLLRTQSGFDQRAPLSSRSGLGDEGLERDFGACRIGWLGDLQGHLPFEAGILSLCEDALKNLSLLGLEVESAKLGFSPARMWESWGVWRQLLLGGSLSIHYDDPVRRAHLKPEVCWEIEQSRTTSAAALYRASIARSDLYRAVLDLFENFDFLVLPSAQVFPFDIATHWPARIAGRAMDTYHRWMEVTVLPTLTGCPALNIPIGFNPEGLPMGMQIIGKPDADWQVLQLGHAWEQASPWSAMSPQS